MTLEQQLERVRGWRSRNTSSFGMPRGAYVMPIDWHYD